MAQERSIQEQTQEPTNVQVVESNEAKTTEIERKEGEDQIERPSRGFSMSELANPFTMLKRLLGDFGMASAFGSPFELAGTNAWSPAIETFEREGKVVVRAEIPGVKPDDVRVEVVGDELVVSGERKEEKTEEKGSRRYSERRYGRFERRFTLPADVETKNIEASFDSGVLEVSFAVPEKRTSRKIDIKTGTSEKKEPPGSIH